ncbi:enterochelin esterase [Allostreptomyces psammosilenae]|uniref:Enterochelin esterase family protein n=1 Tax=Allostreptomyces psammosilenae TaxID=1892865 RepID=A0A853A1N5_9ACTN|nr:enterochelin esterase [Allostreptomyces psammosilenae]NYI08325.1 enterochelin esterase family protein [Allostreptomyces psammosilenae]
MVGSDGRSAAPHVPRPEPVASATSPRLERLAAEVAAGDGGALARFWSEAAAGGGPLVEPVAAPGEGRGVGRYAVTFLWRDRDPAAADARTGAAETRTRGVAVLVNRLSDPRLVENAAMRRLAGTDVWFRSFLLDGDWRGSYHLLVDDHRTPLPEPPAGLDPRRARALLRHAVPDPLNPRRLPSRWGGPGVSVAELPAAPALGEWRRRPGVPAGLLTEHAVDSDALGERRRVWAYTPPAGAVAAGARLPVLVLLDGEMWGPRLSVATLLDNLVAERRLPPLLALLPDSVDVGTRARDYGCDASFTDFLHRELLPWAERHLGATSDPAATVVAGESFGGLAALFAALRAPERFGNVLAQSASLWFRPPAPQAGPRGTGQRETGPWETGEREAGRREAEPDAGSGEWLTERFAEASGAGGAAGRVRFHLRVGRLEWQLLPPNRRLRRVLEAAGRRVTLTEYNGGHDYACWRGGLTDGLVELLGAGDAARPADPADAAPRAG